MEFDSFDYIVDWKLLLLKFCWFLLFFLWFILYFKFRFDIDFDILIGDFLFEYEEELKFALLLLEDLFEDLIIACETIRNDECELLLSLENFLEDLISVFRIRFIEC